MVRITLPIVDGSKRLFDAIELGSKEWYDLVNGNKSFRYEPDQTEYGKLLNAFTVATRRDGYWYATRKVAGKLRQYYVGKTDELEYSTLQNAAKRLSLSHTEYRAVVTNPKKVIEKMNQENLLLKVKVLEVIEPSNNDSLYYQQQAAELQAENTSLQNQIAALTAQLAAVQAERDELEEKNQHFQEQLAKLQLKLSPTIPIVGIKKITHPKPTCPYCGSNGHHKYKGVRNNKRRWICVDCNKSFTVDIGAA